MDQDLLNKPIFPPGIENGFGTIAMDPPWLVGNTGGNLRRSARRHYPLMTIEEIAALPVSDLTKENAHLWLWVTFDTLWLAEDLIKGWGFTPRSLFTWIKPNHCGLGNYLRHACEYVIMSTKGRAPVKVKNQIDYGIFYCANHSHKPEEFYSVIERTSHGPYLEMFARRERKGWARWGLETVSDVVIPGFPVPEYSKAITDSIPGDYMGSDPQIDYRPPRDAAHMPCKGVK